MSCEPFLQSGQSRLSALEVFGLEFVSIEDCPNTTAIPLSQGAVKSLKSLSRKWTGEHTQRFLEILQSALGFQTQDQIAEALRSQAFEPGVGLAFEMLWRNLAYSQLNTIQAEIEG